MSKVMVIYHSQQYGNTAQMAEAVAEGCREVVGTEVTLINVNEARVDMDAFAACDGVALGSPDYFSYVAGGLKQFFDDAWIARRAGMSTGDKPCVQFLSHGGGGKAISALQRLCNSMGYTPVADPVSCVRAPSEEGIQVCRDLGRTLAQKMG